MFEFLEKILVHFGEEAKNAIGTEVHVKYLPVIVFQLHTDHPAKPGIFMTWESRPVVTADDRTNVQRRPRGAKSLEFVEQAHSI